MSELKAVHAFDVYEAYTKTGDDDAAQVYLKSEADKVIAEKDAVIEEQAKEIKFMHQHCQHGEHCGTSCAQIHGELMQATIEIAELKNRIAPKQSDNPLQERLNEVCKKHAVSTLQDLDWAFCMAEARLEDYTKLAAEKHESLEKMLQYKVLYKEKCRDINTQERFFAMNVAHEKYKRCLAMKKMCQQAQYKYSVLSQFESSQISPNPKSYKRYDSKFRFYLRWRKRWLAIAEKFKEAK